MRKIDSGEGSQLEALRREDDDRDPESSKQQSAHLLRIAGAKRIE